MILLYYSSVLLLMFFWKTMYFPCCFGLRKCRTELTFELQEIMRDPHIAADGFTYEVEAIKGWIESGHNTSPMTNLMLRNHELIPNRALRSAIQEWLQNHPQFWRICASSQCSLCSLCAENFGDKFLLFICLHVNCVYVCSRIVYRKLQSSLSS